MRFERPTGGQLQLCPELPQVAHYLPGQCSRQTAAAEAAVVVVVVVIADDEVACSITMYCFAWLARSLAASPA
jgi:hypothetical protein